MTPDNTHLEGGRPRGDPTQTISLRLTAAEVLDLRTLAAEADVPVSRFLRTLVRHEIARSGRYGFVRS